MRKNLRLLRQRRELLQEIDGQLSYFQEMKFDIRISTTRVPSGKTIRCARKDLKRNRYKILTLLTGELLKRSVDQVAALLSNSILKVFRLIWVWITN